MQIIPAIDIIDGKCVRLSEGNYNRKKVYNKDPLEVARQFEDAGLNRLHLVDLDGAKEGKVKNWKVLELIAGKTSLVIGSVAVKQEDELLKWFSRYGTGKFFIGADVMNEKIAVNGWQQITAIVVFDFIQKFLNSGVQQIFCTDISKDGLLNGPAVSLYRKILSKFPGLKLVASGGVSSLKDIDELKLTGCSGVIIGKAIYENRISLEELKSYNT
jgi:phosphoribosylformimino-5-aminoimidazole carboxamide ribotide isomerase